MELFFTLNGARSSSIVGTLFCRVLEALLIARRTADGTLLAHNLVHDGQVPRSDARTRRATVPTDLFILTDPGRCSPCLR